MNTIDPTLAAGSARDADVAQQQRRMEQMRRDINTGAPKDKEAKLREACEGFESVFIQKMWEQMQATLPKDGYLHSKDEKMWQGMYDQELSKKMSAAGGIGLADMMMTQLSKNLEDASLKTVQTQLGRREPMPIDPVPLLPGSATTKAVTGGDDLYSGVAPAVAAVPEPEADPSLAGQTSDAAAGLASAQAPALAPDTPEAAFATLLGRLETEMQTPVVRTVTRVIQPNTPQPGSNAWQKIPRVPADHPITGRSVTQAPQSQPAHAERAERQARTGARATAGPGLSTAPSTAPVVAPQHEPGPSLSPTAVSEVRTAALQGTAALLR